MLSTIIFAAIFLGLLVPTVVLWAIFLRTGLRWAEVSDVTTRRVVRATVIVIVLQVALSLLFGFFSPFSHAQSIVAGPLELAASVVVPWAVIMGVFKISFRRAFLAWLPTLVVTPVVALIVLRVFVYEAFTVPTNAMAPTLVGQHWKGICPQCGSSSFCSPSDERVGATEPLMICEKFHVTQAAVDDKSVYAGDRFMVAKFLTPRRWDLIVFHYPAAPQIVYVKRLVGLPGEEISIRDGAVWVDGSRQTPPDPIRGVEYLSGIPELRDPEVWGSENRPALLGDDEYFVLGDFSARSMDSRMWQKGAPGHNPFAVPQSHVKGVVTHTFWPMPRWHIHR